MKARSLSDTRGISLLLMNLPPECSTFAETTGIIENLEYKKSGVSPEQFTQFCPCKCVSESEDLLGI